MPSHVRKGAWGTRLKEVIPTVDDENRVDGFGAETADVLHVAATNEGMRR